MWFDSHLHLDEGDDASGLFTAARAAGVTTFLVAGTTLDDSYRAVMVAGTEAGVVAAAGVHPHAASTAPGVEAFRELLAEPRVVAVGEIGLDYHYDHSPRPDQRRVFAAFLDLARALRLPVIVHCREAFADCLPMLAEAAAGGQAILIHSFTGTPAQAEAALQVGAYLSFNGIVTFPKADVVRAALAVVPVERLLLETDAPYLAPVPHRGQRNVPAWVAAVGQRVAVERGLPAPELARITSANARRLFRMDERGL